MCGSKYFGVMLSLLLFTSVVRANAHDNKPSAETIAECELQAQALFKVYVMNPYGFGGISPKGAKRLEKMAKNLPEVVKNWNSTLGRYGQHSCDELDGHGFKAKRHSSR